MQRKHHYFHGFMIVFSLILVLMLTACSSEKSAKIKDPYTLSYASQRYDSIIGKWKSPNGDAIEFKEDGTFWRTGTGYSENGKYTLHQEQWLPIGDTYRPYPCLDLQLPLTSKIYFYFLSGNTLKICDSVDHSNGTFPKNKTITYERQIDQQSAGQTITVSLAPGKASSPEEAIAKYTLAILKFDAERAIEVTQFCDEVTSHFIANTDISAFYTDLYPSIQEEIQSDYGGDAKKYLSYLWTFQGNEMRRVLNNTKSSGEQAVATSNICIELVSVTKPMSDSFKLELQQMWGNVWLQALENTAYVEYNVINQQTGKRSTEHKCLIQHNGSWYVFDTLSWSYR